MNDKKQLLIEADGSVRAHLLAPEKRVRPNLQTGVGVYRRGCVLPVMDSNNPLLIIQPALAVQRTEELN